MPASQTPRHDRRNPSIPGLRAQAQLDTEALIVASRAYERAEQVDGRVTEHFDLLNQKMDNQHADNKASLKWITGAVWAGAAGLIGMLLTHILPTLH